MPVIEHLIEVRWRHRVHFSDHVFAPANPLLRDVLVEPSPHPSPVRREREFERRVRAMVVIDDSLARAKPGLAGEIKSYFERGSGLLLVGEPLLMPGGEAVKNDPQHVATIHAAINERHIDRQSTVIAVGGGALLDMVGFAAATAHRGVRHVRIPTTTLSQADSGVGVKNGINAFGKKNFIGAFAPPLAVINDFQLLATLPERDRRCGLVEAVKVACIRDPEFFTTLEHDCASLATFESDAMRRVIRRCAELHLKHIATSGDPFESGSARPLDFGHWAAHKLEQLSEYRIRHGEAVAIGIALDVIYSRRVGWLAESSAERILRVLEGLGFTLFAAELLQTEGGRSVRSSAFTRQSAGNTRGRLKAELQTTTLSVLTGLEEFREHLGGGLAITLLKEIGVGAEANEMQPALVVEAIRELKERAGKAESRK